MPERHAMKEQVVVVTGASRGIGKGIALALASKGATVYVTGRTATTGTHLLPGTVRETAKECNTRGGKGIAVQVDHSNDEEVGICPLIRVLRSLGGELFESRTANWPGIG